MVRGVPWHYVAVQKIKKKKRSTARIDPSTLQGGNDRDTSGSASRLRATEQKGGVWGYCKSELESIPTLQFQIDKRRERLR